MISFIRKLFSNSIVSYIFFGGCTTLVNVGLYYLLRWITPLDMNIVNIISITSSIIFAYFTNAKWVFHSEVKGLKGKLIEFVKFFGARLVTLVLEMAAVPFLAWIGINDLIAKVIATVVVLVLNYIFSKLFVFRNRRGYHSRH